jgi:hypothetical protein
MPSPSFYISSTPNGCNNLLIRRDFLMDEALTLKKALSENRLSEFIAQEEARGVGPANKKDFDAAVRLLATTPLRSEDRT